MDEYRALVGAAPADQHDQTSRHVMPNIGRYLRRNCNMGGHAIWLCSRTLGTTQQASLSQSNFINKNGNKVAPDCGSTPIPAGTSLENAASVAEKFAIAHVHSGLQELRQRRFVTRALGHEPLSIECLEARTPRKLPPHFVHSMLRVHQTCVCMSMFFIMK